MPVQIDPSLRRVITDGFQYPIGAYPVEELSPKAGYSSVFEKADGGGDDDDWEEWPDRYVYDVVISADRVPALCRVLFSLLPDRVYPILDVLGHDAYREVDPYMAYDLVGLDVFLDGVREFGDFLYEDGMVGFGVMSESPFLYVFVDEHKIITIRCAPELKERIEKTLAAFDLEQTEEAAGCDAAAHEHRSVLVAPSDRPDLLTPEEVIEDLRDGWRLLLNVDPEANVDDQGNELGTTTWRAIVRCHLGQEGEGTIIGAGGAESKTGTGKASTSKPTPAKATGSKGPAGGGLAGRAHQAGEVEARYAEVYFDADNLRQAEDVALSAVEDLATAEEVLIADALVIEIARFTPEVAKQALTRVSEEQAGGKRGKAEKKEREQPRSRPRRGAKKGDDAVHVPLAGTVYACRWLV